MPPDLAPEPAAVLMERSPLGVVRLTLNRPERRNALTEELAAALRVRLTEVARDDSVRVLVLTGAGRAFCAGADLGRLGARAATVQEKEQVLRDYYRAFLDLRDLKIPTIAAIQGPAIGAGLNLALCCDLRVLARGARLAAPFVKLGIHPGGGATWMLSRLAGTSAAREMLLLGEPVSAERALQVGLAGRLVEDGEELPAALEWASSLAALPRPVLLDLKRTLALAESGADFDQVLELETVAQARSLTSEDAGEGWAALRERRPPRFRDR
ncbi:MAG: enoyl-CoA hydratase/isomerase family protein [Candidatus Dormibacteria bacterium]